MSLPPDTKDWTWVLERVCPECGYDAARVPAVQVGDRLRAEVPVWVEALGEPGCADRVEPERWSALEYACHVRDVCRLFALRFSWMLEQAVPRFANWDQDATAVEQRYGEQDPEVVADELTEAAGDLALTLDAVDAAHWQRTGVRSDGAVFTVDSLSRYLLHDIVHHTWDVTGRPAP